MAKHLIVYGHGQQDPGAGGNGYEERNFTRYTLGPHLEKYAKQLKKNSIDFYDKSLNMYYQTQAGRGAYTTSTSYASVSEFHLDAAGSSATGGHVIVSKSFSADKYDLAIAQVVNKYVGWWGSVKGSKGISYRSDLLNLNVYARRGISYRLVELAFITNKTDMQKLVKNIDAVAKEMVEAITGEKLSGSTGGNTNTSKPSKPSTTVKNTTKYNKGDKVKVLSKATHYQTGQSIASFVKGSTYTVKEVKEVNQSNSKYAFLLSGINSWVLAQDLQKVSGGGSTTNTNSGKKDYSKDYYTTNPGKVKLLKADGLRAPNDVNWTGNSKYGGYYPAGTVFKIKGIKTTSSGLPRLVTESGFLLTANRKYVQKI